MLSALSSNNVEVYQYDPPDYVKLSCALCNRKITFTTPEKGLKTSLADEINAASQKVEHALAFVVSHGPRKQVALPHNHFSLTNALLTLWLYCITFSVSECQKCWFSKLRRKLPLFHKLLWIGTVRLLCNLPWIFDSWSPIKQPKISWIFLYDGNCLSDMSYIKSRCIAFTSW